MCGNSLSGISYWSESVWNAPEYFGFVSTVLLLNGIGLWVIVVGESVHWVLVVHMLMSQSEPILMEVLMDSSIISEKEHILMFWTMLLLSSENKVMTILKSFAFISIFVWTAVCHSPQLPVTSLIGVTCSVYAVITV